MPPDTFDETKLCLEGLTSALKRAGFAEKADVIDALRRKLADDELHVVVIGEFKRGKSTLINALLGKSLLPVASIPLTSVVTLVRFGEAPAAFVEFLDGGRRQVPVESIADYVAEEFNPNNVKKVSRVIVHAPSELLSRGLVLVDTPGIGSVYRHNTEVAERYLPEADAVIMVLSADPPIGAAEAEFLRSARRWARRLLVVLNKVDHLDAVELPRAWDFTERSVRSALEDSGIKVHALSAKRGLEGRLAGDHEKEGASGLVAFERALLESVARQRRAILIDATSVRAKHILDTAIFETNAAISAASAHPQTLKQTIAQLGVRLAEIQEKQYELSRVYSAKLEDLRRDFETALYDSMHRRSREIEKELELHYSALRGRPAEEFRAAMNKALLDAVESFFTEHLARIEPIWATRFQELTDGFLSRAVELLDGVMKEASVALGAPHRPLVRPVLGVSPPSVWFVLEPVSTWSGGIQSIPTLRVFRPFFWRAVRQRVAQVMDTNAGRVRHDHQRRVEKAGEAALAAINEFFQESAKALQRTLREIESRKELAGRDAEMEKQVREKSRLELERSATCLDRIARVPAGR